MKIETRISLEELDNLANGLAETFIQRWDLYPQQIDNGSYLCLKKPLTNHHIKAHLLGEITLGVYLLSKDSQARFIVIDADDEEQYTQVSRMAASLEHHGVPSYLERSRRGGHLWLFFEEPVPGKDARSFGKGLITSHSLPQEIELYPKQDELGDGPGSLIRLPFGVHRKDGNRYGFVQTAGEKITPLLRNQIPQFYSPKTVSEAAFDEFWRIGQPEPQTPEFTPTEAAGDTLSERIKVAITVPEFVGQYVSLTEAGRGHCPFHDDKNRSFSVNEEHNYWHCFAGCGGGSVIDFWMQYKSLEFVEAVRELAGMLLK
ncbi:hypothetical protein KQH40_00310 [bacterium]|nr:hypothetical protein [bacterium]